MSEAAMVESGRQGVMQEARLYQGLGIVCRAIYNELKDIAATRLQLFATDPQGHPVSDALRRLHLVSRFCGQWGLGNMLGALVELAQVIEKTPPESGNRTEQTERVKTLASGISALGSHARDAGAGLAVSYSGLNDVFAQVLKKARPPLLDLTPVELARYTFMAAPPSLEAEASWVPAPGASRQALRAALADIAESLSDTGVGLANALEAAVRTNPYRTLSGLFDAAAAQPLLCADEPVSEMLVAECGRLGRLLSADKDPVEPPTPDAFLFSYLMHGIAASDLTGDTIASLRRRYSLSKPRNGAAGSMYDVAKRYADAMSKLREAYQQAVLAATPSVVKKLATTVLADSSRLESAAFIAHAGNLAWVAERLVNESADFENWVLGAATVLLMTESAASWGNERVQAELASLGALIRGAQQILPCESLQEQTRNQAVQKVCNALASDSTKLKLSMEGAVRALGVGAPTAAQAANIVATAGADAVAMMNRVAGVSECFGLPRLAAAARIVGARAGEGDAWMTEESQARLFDDFSRVMAVLSRLRPASLIDMQTDEAGDLAAAFMVPDEGVVVGAEAHVDAPNLPQEEVVFNHEPTAVAQVESHPEDAPTGADEAPSTVDASDEVSEETAELKVEGADISEAEGPQVVVHAEPESAPEAGAAAPEAVDSTLSGAAEHLVVEPEHAAVDVADSFGDMFGLDVPDAPAGSAEQSFQPAEPKALLREFLAASQGRDDALDVSDVALMNIMFEESQECVTQLEGIVAQCRDEAAQSETRVGLVAEMRRLVHTLKGVLRTVGLMKAGAILHAMEDRLEVIPDDGVVLVAELDAYAMAIEDVARTIESARSYFEMSQMGVDVAESAATLPVAPPAANEVAPQPEAPQTQAQADEVAEVMPVGEDAGSAGPLQEHNVQSDAAPPAAQAPVAVQPMPAAPAQMAQSVRVPVTLAARLGDTSGRVMLAAQRSLEELDVASRNLADLEAGLGRMDPVLRRLDIIAAASVASTASASNAVSGFDALEFDRYTELQEVVRLLKEAHEDALASLAELASSIRSTSSEERHRAELTEDLQRHSSELMLVSLATQRQRLERVVASACRDTGKRASLVIEPGCKAPASSMDRLMPALEHLLRNAVAHGIESPQRRAELGKPESGTITLGVSADAGAEAGTVTVCVRDDGAGVNTKRVLEIASSRGLCRAGHRYDDAAIHEFLFMPGFSTAQSVSELAGRGVGLDSVRAIISGVGGLVSVRSQPGTGAEFTMTLPADASTMSVVPVVSAGVRCLIPLSLVQRIVPVSQEHSAQLGKSVVIEGAEYEVVSLDRRVPIDAGTNRPASRRGRGHLLLMRSQGAQRAVLVDAVGAQTRLVVRPLGPVIREVPGLLAAATVSDGSLALVLNPLVLEERQPEPRQAARAGSSLKRVLIVDDSPTVRLVTSRLLTRHGFDATTAHDGINALELISRGVQPDAFVLDLEMPGMDGFALLAELRRARQFVTTPIIIVSSRGADKHQQRARELGATAYLQKPCDESRLLELLRGLLER